MPKLPAPPADALHVAAQLKEAAAAHGTPAGVPAAHSPLGLAWGAVQLALANPEIRAFLMGIEQDALARLVAAIGGLAGPTTKASAP